MKTSFMQIGYILPWQAEELNKVLSSGEPINIPAIKREEDEHYCIEINLSIKLTSIAKKNMRECFENHMKEIYKEFINLEKNECGYVDEQMDAFWVGYQIGCRHMEEA